MTYVPTETLDYIQRFDPDGGSVQPTDADYTAFQKWVRDTYGDAVWDVYRAGGWAPPPEV